MSGSGFSGATSGPSAVIGQGMLPGIEGSPRPSRAEKRRSAKEDKEIVDLAQKRFKRTLQWESVFRTRALDDLKFAEADAYNGYQWPNSIRKSRDIDDRPCLTINKARQHNLQIINDAKKNKAEIKVRPTGNEATYESAQVMTDTVRHIQYQSNFDAALGVVTGFQVRMGYGVFRVSTDYASDDSFDQEIYIKAVKDPLTVLFDPDCKEVDKSDARFAFIFDDLDRDEFKEIYPQYKDYIPSPDIGVPMNDDWIADNKVRICEYFYKEASEDKLVHFTDPLSGQERTAKASDLPKDLLHSVLDNPATRQRSIVWNTVKWCVIVGDTIAERQEWPGTYIPLVPVIGEETVIDGVMDRKGHTRAMLDPQRMYNYWSSAAVEFGALQTKTPWIAPAAAIEGLETYWNNANRQNVSVLPWNHMDDDSQPVPPPQKAPAPEQAQLFIEGMQLTQTEMMLVSGQYQAQMGQPSNERSGTAIQERQRQGDNATYHYIDGQAIAIRQLGKILIELIPKIYDSPRLINIMAQNGITYQVQVDPNAQQSFMQVQNSNKQAVQRIFNPNLGKYDVVADTGPGFATKREEAFNALTQIITQAPALTNMIGDILLENADFPGAEEAAQRLKRMLPPQATGQGPSQNEQMLEQQLQQLKHTLAITIEQLAEEKLKLKGKDQQKDIDVYEAETDRLKAMHDMLMADPTAAKELVKQLVMEALGTSLGPVLQSAMPGLALNTQGDNSPSPSPSQTSGAAPNGG